MSHDVFVSYSTKDKAVADAIVASLEKRKIRCWYAPRDVKPGADWGTEIAFAISESSVFLIIFSGNANRSQRVLDELNLAISKEVPILPFRIENLNPSGAMQLHLATRHWLDAFVPSWEKHINRLILAVSSMIKQEKQNFPTLEQDTPKTVEKQRENKNWIGIVVGTVVLVGLVAIWVIPELLKQNATNTTLPQATSTNVSGMESLNPIPGSTENPIIWMYVPPFDQEFNDVNAAAAEIAETFAERNGGLVIKPIPASNMSSIVQALCDGNAHLGSLDGFAYLEASERGCAETKMIWSAYDDINYSGELLVRSDSEIKDIADIKGKSLCIPAYDSISGWTIPSLEIKATVGDPFAYFSDIVEMGNHDEVLEAVYNGNCEVGTAYFDIRESSSLVDVMDQVKYVQTFIAMPNQNISYSQEIDPNLSALLTSFFLSISTENNDLALVSGYRGEMEIKELIEINDYYYNELRDLFDRAGENPEDYYQ